MLLMLLAWLLILENVNADCKSFDLSIVVDDFMILYVDGDRITDLPIAFRWHTLDTVRLPCAIKLIAIQGINMIANSGIRASDSSGYILTNSSWKCTNVSYPGWEKLDFDDSKWPGAVVTNYPPVQQWSGLNANSRWIWSSEGTQRHNLRLRTNLFAYCRKKLAVNECVLFPPHNLCNPSAGRCEDTPNGYRCICHNGYANTKNESCEAVPENSTYSALLGVSIFVILILVIFAAALVHRLLKGQNVSASPESGIQPKHCNQSSGNQCYEAIIIQQDNLLYDDVDV